MPTTTHHHHQVATIKELTKQLLNIFLILLTWPDVFVDGEEDGDSEQVHDQREDRHHLEEEEDLGRHCQDVRLVEIVEKILR